tara:strand:+ start:66 stop:191 length:126 start_codon:yes stop_codon:yes gene_type:complete
MVSLRVSPLATEEVEPVTGTTPPPIRTIAAAKEQLVRVDGS